MKVDSGHDRRRCESGFEKPSVCPGPICCAVTTEEDITMATLYSAENCRGLSRRLTVDALVCHVKSLFQNMVSVLAGLC